MKRKSVFILIITIFLFIDGMVELHAQDTVWAPVKQKESNFFDRVDIGGYLGAQFGTYTLIDIAPMVSYRLTENFHPGIGLTYQYYKINYSSAPDYSTSAYGGSIFGRYYIWHDLFAHVEYAPLYVTYYDYYYDYTGNYSYRQKGSAWVHDMLVGGGYRQWLGQNAFVSLMLLWNVNESYYSPYRNPIIRIGFGIGL
jgi:hypothetical protein